MEIKINQVAWFDDRYYKVEYQDENDKTVTDYFASVTTKLGVIAKPFLAKWRGDIGNREADYRVQEAGQRGTRIHNSWNMLAIRGVVIFQPFQKPNYLPPEIDALKLKFEGKVAILEEQDEMYAVYKLMKWCEEVKPKFIVNELTVYSIKNRDAGTVDNVIDIEGGDYAIAGTRPLTLPKGRYVVDLKSGNQVGDDADLQLAAYMACLHEMFGWEFQGSLIIHTSATTTGGIQGLTTKYRNREESLEDYNDYRIAASMWERKNKGKLPKVFDFPSMITLEATDVAKL